MRIFYYGLINTSKYSENIGLPIHVGAASNKIQSVLSALRLKGVRSYLVTQPIIKSLAKGTKPSKHLIIRYAGIASLFFPVRISRYLRFALGSLDFAVFSAKKIRLNDKVILYNAEPEFVLALLVLRLKGITPYLDVEDYFNKPTTIRWMIKKWMLGFFIRMTHQRKLVASRKIARSLNLQDACVVHGVLGPDLDVPKVLGAQDLAPKAAKELHVHFGGQASSDAGFNILVGAIKILGERIEDTQTRIHFHITGLEASAAYSKASRYLGTANILATVYGDLERERYLSVISACDVSLSLRKTGSELEQYTFPSKIIEITALGVALIVTPSEEVRQMFSDSEVIYMRKFSASDLAITIWECACDVDKVRRIAASGQLRASVLFSADRIGQEILEALIA